MSELIILVETAADWKDDLPQLPVVNARDYLAQTQHTERRDLHVINLCRGYRYLSIGYYCSLLAEARGHRVIPSVRTLQDLSRKSIYTLETEALERLLRKALQRQATPDQTEFDWRVGILGGEPVFVCQYYMSKQHWQIVNYAVHGRPQMGMAKTFAVSEAPRKVVKIALKAANLIGDGLYGVDVKEHPRGLFVIEVNDNPNIDAGVEDLVLKNQLYRRVIDELARRLDRLRAH